MSVVNHRGGAMRWTDPANIGGVRFASTANALGIYNLDGGTLTVARPLASVATRPASRRCR